MKDHVVLISGDEEYRSEESLPQCASSWPPSMGSMPQAVRESIRKTVSSIVDPEQSPKHSGTERLFKEAKT